MGMNLLKSMHWIGISMEPKERKTEANLEKDSFR
jgi:hypothetical protein